MNEPHYPINLFWSAEDDVWIADVPDLQLKVRDHVAANGQNEIGADFAGEARDGDGDLIGSGCEVRRAEQAVRVARHIAHGVRGDVLNLDLGVGNHNCNRRTVFLLECWICFWIWQLPDFYNFDWFIIRLSLLLQRGNI